MRIHQFTFDPGDKRRSVPLDLFDADGNPVEVRVTVLSCPGDEDDGAETPEPEGVITLAPGGWHDITDLFEAPDAPVHLALRANECPRPEKPKDQSESPSEYGYIDVVTKRVPVASFEGFDASIAAPAPRPEEW